MSRDEAKELAIRLRGLMPRMTEEQAWYVLKEIEIEPKTVVEAAIYQYARDFRDFTTADFGRVLRRHKERHAASLTPARLQSFEEEQRIRREEEVAMAVVEALTDAEFDKFRAEAIDAQPVEFVRRNWRRAAGRSHRGLNLAIAALLQKRSTPARGFNAFVQQAAPAAARATG